MQHLNHLLRGMALLLCIAAWSQLSAQDVQQAVKADNSEQAAESPKFEGKQAPFAVLLDKYQIDYSKLETGKENIAFWNKFLEEKAKELNADDKAYIKTFIQAMAYRMEDVKTE